MNDKGISPTRAIHKYELKGGYYVVDPCSGSVHVADKQAYDLLDKVTPARFEHYEGVKEAGSACLAEDKEHSSVCPESEQGGCYAELRELYKAGLLFAEDECEKYAETSIDAPLKALCLHVSHDCNLRCRYCFAKEVLCNEGIHSPQSEHDNYAKEVLCNEGIHSPQSEHDSFAEDNVSDHTAMSPETAIAAIDFLVAHSGERTELEADFFGGEPLMAWDTVTAAVAYARANEQSWGKRFRFTITTNGLLLDDEKIAYINAEMTNCVMSLDGRRSVNDIMRPTANGKGSFDVVVPKFRKLIKTRTKEGFTDHYIRGTFTAFNLDFAEDVIELARLGFRNISLEPVTCTNEADYAITNEHIPQIYEQYDKLFMFLTGCEHSQEVNGLDSKGINFFHFNVDLTGGACVIRRLRGCGAGNEYLAVAPNGDCYPCHRFVGNSAYNMGSVSKTLSLNIKEYFSKTHIYSKSDCSECWARFYCSGGCNASSYDCYGDCRRTDSQSVECLMMKKRLECAIALAAMRLNVANEVCDS
ncbi:MAG: thioether cross-link-forming SCIFF peptide maturase [Oscillospiraceae bacterium]|nr:thioether cross-link-forming SCIFF peptide maturase [Oscillospiraceae bacterium]